MTSRGDVKSVMDSEPIKDIGDFLSSSYDAITSIRFPQDYAGVFAVSSADELRLWSPENQNEMLRIELK